MKRAQLKTVALANLNATQLKQAVVVLAGGSRGSSETGVYILVLRHVLALAKAGKVEQAESDVNALAECLVNTCTYANKIGMAKTLKGGRARLKPYTARELASTTD